MNESTEDIEKLSGMTGDLTVSISGGKDSTATYLHLLETGFLENWEARGGKVVRVFADTGWELPETYAYIERLERTIGKIHRVAVWVPGPDESKPEGFDFLAPMWKSTDKRMAADRHAMAKSFELRLGRYSPMVRLICHWAWFPMTKNRWCTDNTKKLPLVAYLQQLDSPVNVVGVRAEESRARAGYKTLEWSDDWDCWMWRPIKHFTLADVVSIHKRYGISPNALYLQGTGAARVGCAPCVNSNKANLSWLAGHHMDRLDLLGDLEKALDAVTGKTHTWFAGKNGDGEFEGWPVETAIEWAYTARGGRQHVLFRGEDEPGCTQWGLCEVPTREE